MKKLQEIFRRDEILQCASPLLSENYYFSPTNNPGLSEYKIMHQEVRLIENPLYLVRKYFLVRDLMKEIPIQITISLAWDGFDRALDFLFGFTESLDLLFNPEKVLNTRAYALGDFGVAWWWVIEELNVLVFIRNNVFVGIQGFLPKEKMVLVARSIDAGLKEVSTKNPYRDEQQGFIAENLKKTTRVCVPSGGRLDIGIQRPGTETVFFITTAGSMNRDLIRPDLWYFRAGKEVGTSDLILLRVDEGILPKRETLQIEVVSE